MVRKIRFSFDDKVQIEAELLDNITADKIYEALPIESVGNLWGDEVYFSTTVESRLDESSRSVVKLGDIGYWPPSRAICIFYGKTPVSTDDEIRPASAVNIVGRVTGEVTALKKLKEHCQVIVDRV